MSLTVWSGVDPLHSVLRSDLAGQLPGSERSSDLPGGGRAAMNGPVPDSAQLHSRLGEPTSHSQVICRRPRPRVPVLVADCAKTCSVLSPSSTKERVVERLRVELRLPAEVIQRPGAGRGHGQVGKIQLEHQACMVDRLALLRIASASALGIPPGS